MASPASPDAAAPPDKGRELRSFVILAVLLAPALSVAFVGGLGLVIWLYQLFVGPPGAPPP